MIYVDREYQVSMNPRSLVPFRPYYFTIVAIKQSFLLSFSLLRKLRYVCRTVHVIDANCNIPANKRDIVAWKGQA